MQNEIQYDLDRKAAKMFALSSNNLDKYKYLTGEDLGLKPSNVEQAKFEYSTLGKIFNKELKEEDKKEGLLKRLKNIEKNQNSNNNDKSNLISARSESSFYSTPLSSARSKSISNDKLDRSVYSPTIQKSCYSDIFDSDLKEFFNYIASKEEKKY